MEATQQRLLGSRQEKVWGASVPAWRLCAAFVPKLVRNRQVLSPLSSPVPVQGQRSPAGWGLALFVAQRGVYFYFQLLARRCGGGGGNSRRQDPV